MKGNLAILKKMKNIWFMITFYEMQETKIILNT